MLIVAGVFPPEPIVSASIMHDLATELSKNCNVTVIRPHPTRPAGFCLDNYDNSRFPFRVIEMDSYVCPQSSMLGRFRESISSGYQAAKYIRKHHNEIDFIYNDPWQLFGVNIVARTAVKYGIPYFMAVQDIYPEALLAKLPNISVVRKIVSACLIPIDKYNERHAARVHTISDQMVSYLSATRGIEPNKYISVRNWQDESQFLDFDPTSVKSDFDGITFMYVGNVGPLAGLGVVIEAFKKANLGNARLVIAGSGSAREALKWKVENEGIARVTFRDVPGGQIPATQALADVMILPVKKGFAMSSIPSKLPAYMFSAKPILAAVDLESDTARCVNDSDAGWVIEPENVEKLATAFAKIVTLPSELLKSKGENGCEFAIANLSKRGNLPILVNAVNEVLYD